MDATQMFEGLEEFDHAQVRGRGEGALGRQRRLQGVSMRRTRRYGKGDWARIKEEGDGVFARLADLMAEGAHAAGRAAMDLAEGLAAFVQDAILANEARWRNRQ